MDTTTMTSDHDLVERAQQGDQRAFADLVSRHDRRLRALASRLLRDGHCVDDVVQEAYLKAFRNLGRFRADAAVATWLYRITYNACVDELRRNRPFVQSAEDPGDPADRAVASVSAAEVLADLSQELRATVVLVHLYGFDYEEAARLLGVPEGTIGSRLNRARCRLQREGVADNAA